MRGFGVLPNETLREAGLISACVAGTHILPAGGRLLACGLQPNQGVLTGGVGPFSGLARPGGRAMDGRWGGGKGRGLQRSGGTRPRRLIGGLDAGPVPESGRRGRRRVGGALGPGEKAAGAPHGEGAGVLTNGRRRP